jgi:hypothetical protein
VAQRSGQLQLCFHLDAWADRSGTLTPMSADGCGSPGFDPGSLAVTVLHRPRGVDPVDGLAARSPGVADPWLAAAERRLLDPVVLPGPTSCPPDRPPSICLPSPRADLPGRVSENTVWTPDLLGIAAVSARVARRERRARAGHHLVL